MSEGKNSGLKLTFLNISRNLFSKQTGVFLIFVVIATALWMVTSLNEEVTKRVDCTFDITNVPDSVIFINTPPTTLSFEVRGRGTSLIKHFVGEKSVIKVDFAKFAQKGRFVVSKRNLIEITQSYFGSDYLIQDISPDSVSCLYTSRSPTKLPVKISTVFEASPNYSIIYPIKVLNDTIDVYVANGVTLNDNTIETIPGEIKNISSTQTVKIPLSTPSGCRLIPDSVEVQINVEPIVTEVNYIEITAVNIPQGYDVTLSPSRIKTFYRVPVSAKDKLPEVKIIADFGNLAPEYSGNKIGIRAVPLRTNVFIEEDSVNFVLKAQK